jgi:hypothetical protein
MSYRTDKDGVIRLSDGTFIPSEPRIQEWQQYQKWLADGNTPEFGEILDERAGAQYLVTVDVEGKKVSERKIRDAPPSRGELFAEADRVTTLAEMKVLMRKLIEKSG